MSPVLHRHASPARTAALLVSLAGLVGACGNAPGGAGSAGGGAPQGVAPPPAEEWVTIAEQSLAGRSATPAPFSARGDTLRVITTMGEAITPLSAGVVITNILSDASMIPVGTVRAEPTRVDSLSADTARLPAGPGPLYVYVAEGRGLRDWHVVIQERKRGTAP